MVVRRRGILMGLVAVAAFVMAALYGIRFTGDQDVVSFLLTVLLLAVAAVHAVAWQGSRSPLMIVDMTGLRLRLGGEWSGLTWNEI
jgi:hypothetical protein